MAGEDTVAEAEAAEGREECMFERLEQIEARYQDLSQQMADPEVLGDHEKYQKIAKQHRELEPVVEKFREYRQVKTLSLIHI